VNREIYDEHPQLKTGLGRLQDKVAIVTGANSGIGRAIARLFAREGARVVCCDIQEITEPRIDKLIESDGGNALFINLDVTKKENCENLIEMTNVNFGTIDVLVNNAGGGVKKKIHELTSEEWHFVVELNLNAVFYTSRAVLPFFIKQKKGNIINTASTFGLLAAPNYSAYCATKAAVINLTRQMALDYGPYGVRVNCLCPGAIETARFRGYPPRPRRKDLTDEEINTLIKSNKALLRLGQPEEVAYGALFLASDESSFITGHALVIDGGQSIAV